MGLWGLKRPMRLDKAENTCNNSYVLGQLHVIVLLPPAVALLWSCLEHCGRPSVLGFPWEDPHPLIPPCPGLSPSPVVLWMRGLMRALFLPYPSK